jgi:hypothetical protein
MGSEGLLLAVVNLTARRFGRRVEVTRRPGRATRLDVLGEPRSPKGAMRMSAERFDELAKAVARGTSRRAALRGVVGWAVKGVAVALGVSAAGALSTQTAEAGKACSGHCDCPKNQVCSNPGQRCTKVGCGAGFKVCKLENSLAPSPIGWTCIPRETTCLGACA